MMSWLGMFCIDASNVDYLEAFTPKPNATQNRVEEAWSPVFTPFPSTKYDALECFKCYAVERNTASVFHLMRVLEIKFGTCTRTQSGKQSRTIKNNKSFSLKRPATSEF